MTNRLQIHINIDIEPASIQTIVETAKAIVGPDDKGHFNIDTADLVGQMVTRFLAEKAFGQYVADPGHYDGLIP
ncbi:MAG: hypothetical protein PVH30_10395 [Desulfobacterales bacterium]|jgi:hypothetical protein